MAGIPNIDIDPPKYGPPNMAAQLFGMISSLPDAYQQGVKQKFERGQMQRQEELQKPLLGPDGKPTHDFGTIQDRLLELGGAQYAKEMFPYLSGVESDKALGGGIVGGGGKPNYTPSNPNMTPDAHTGRTGRIGENEQPAGPAGDDTAHQNIRQLAVNAGIDFNSPDFRQAFAKTDIDREFSSDAQRTGAALKIAGLKRLAGGDAGPSSPTAALGRGEGTVYMPGPGMQGAPQPGQPPVQMAQAGPAPQQAPSDAESRAQAFDAEAARREQVLIQHGRNASPAAKEGALESISNLRDQAKTLRANEAAIAKETDPRARQAKGTELAQKQELTRGDALQKGLQGAAREYETALKPHLDAMRGIMNNPNFVSGSGVGLQAAFNKIRSSPLFSSLPGYDPNAALPNESIRKVMAASILNQTTELKAEAAEMGGSAGRLFQQQISLMEKAAQNEENTLPALRYLTELQTRMGDHASGIAELANNYNGKYGKGVLDNGFNEKLSKYNRDNPIFKPEEIADQRRFAPPPAPAFHTKEEATAWSRKNNIPPGDPIKLPSGKIIPAP